MQLILDELLGYNSELLTKALKRALARAFKEHGYDITAFQWIILYRLWEEHGISQTELAARTFMDSPTITRMLDVMEKKGLVYRQRSSDDRRIASIFLTEAGLALEKKLVPIVEKHHAHALDNISEEEFLFVKKFMKKVIDNLS
ncbi:MAG: MarR family transcriptional regulator [Spirochaetia bacterium]|nr:MarR family transcriptional regulator [Spirochaetia bacterium]